MTNRVFVHIHASEEVTAPAISLILGLGKAKIEIFSNYRNGRCIMALNLEPAYKEIFSKFQTRKKFVIRSVESNTLTIEQDEEICGQKEPKVFEFKSPREFEEFVRKENQFESDIVKQLEGSKMPYR
jgi:hypothetical protein